MKSNTEDSKVEVAKMMQPGQKPREFFRFRIRSIRRPGRISNTDVWADDPKLKKKAAILGGALAEWQNKEFGDSHDPSECAKAGLECFESLTGERRLIVG